MERRDLPFPRGLTASAGLKAAPPAGVAGGMVSLLPSATGLFLAATPYRPDLATYQAEVYAGVQWGDPISGVRMKLRAVQAAAQFTVARKCVTFSTSAKLFGIATSTVPIPSTGSAGLPALAIDHAYPVGTVIAAYDWFWCIEEGPAMLLAGTTTVDQGATMCDANGAAAPATAGLAVIGTADQVVSANGSALVTVWMRSLYNQAMEA